MARIYIYDLKAIAEINKLLRELKPVLVIVDDKLFNYINYPDKQKRREGMVTRKHEENLVKIADNLANYIRTQLKKLKGGSKKLKELIEQFEK